MTTILGLRGSEDEDAIYEAGYTRPLQLPFPNLSFRLQKHQSTPNASRISQIELRS